MAFRADSSQVVHGVAAACFAGDDVVDFGSFERAGAWVVDAAPVVIACKYCLTALRPIGGQCVSWSLPILGAVSHCSSFSISAVTNRFCSPASTPSNRFASAAQCASAASSV